MKPAFALIVLLLADFIAFSIANRPGLTPRLISEIFVVSTGAGTHDSIVAGFLAGYIAKAISSKLHPPQNIEALKPILIISPLASRIYSLIIIYVVDTPVS